MTTGIRLPQGLLPGLEDIVKFYPQKDADCQLYLPLYDYDLRGAEAIVSKDQNLHVATVTGALWRPNGRYFDGVDDIISLPTAFDTVDDCSIEAWMKSPLDSGYNVGMIIGFYKDASNRHALFYNKGYNLRMEARVGNVGKNALTNYAPVANTWYHMVALMGLGGLKLYVDGVIATLTDPIEWTPSSISPMTEVQLGKYWTGDTGNIFKGTIGEVRLYSRRLSVGEIQQSYLATKWRYQ